MELGADVRRGPLHGVRIVEVGGIGPIPFAGMVLADMGAEIVRIERPSGAEDENRDVLHRGRWSIGLDLKHPDGAGTILKLVEHADALIEGFRPGVMERLGIGPIECLERNARLVYGRMTGYGQEGPYANAPGHDINYIALAGVLEGIGRFGAPPTPPLNLVGDFGGGAMFLIAGVLAAIIEAGQSGLGQVVDAAMIDGASLMMSPFRAFRANGNWQAERGTNLVDSGAPMYDAYECSDGRYVSIGALEPQFYMELLRLTDLDDDPDLVDRSNQARWPLLKDKLSRKFRERSRDEWCALLDNSETCFAPVLTIDEAPSHPHHVARGSFVNSFGELQAAPAPRFSRTPGAIEPPRAARRRRHRSSACGMGLRSRRHRLAEVLRSPSLQDSRMKLDLHSPAIVDDAASAAVAAETQGYDAFWAAEARHDPFLPLVVAAEHTTRIGIGTGIAVAFARNPMSLAVLGNDMQHYTKGRFMLGLGSQVRPHIERRFSMPWGQPAARMREHILAIRHIWKAWSTGERMGFNGDFYQHTLSTPYFDPGPNPYGSPRIFLAAVGARMAEVAGEVADGMLGHSFTTARYLEEVTLPAVERGLKASERPRTAFELSIPIFVVTGSNDVELAAAKDATRREIAFYGSTPSYRPVLDLHGWSDLHQQLHAGSKKGDWAAIGALVDDEVLEAFAVVGDPDRIAGRVLERCGGSVDRVSLYAPYEVPSESWDRVLSGFDRGSS